MRMTIAQRLNLVPVRNFSIPPAMCSASAQLMGAPTSLPNETPSLRRAYCHRERLYVYIGIIRAVNRVARLFSARDFYTNFPSPRALDMPINLVSSE